jgi:Uma2 family endonuclease
MSVQIQKRLFNVHEYHRMGEVGILNEDDRLQLLEGVIIGETEAGYYTQTFTVEQYERMVETGILTEDDRVELIGGEILEMSPTGSHHAACVKRLNTLLAARVGAAALISVQDPVVLDDLSEPQPDVALLKPRPDFYKLGHPHVPDVLLVVEVADSSIQRDRLVKLPLYARSGVAEVWLIDLNADRVEVYTQPVGGEYQHIRHAERGETVNSENVPGLALEVNAVLG